MKLWVRSQRKTCLMKINKIRINKDEKWQIESFNEDNYTTIILGEYKSKERALEILDEIHQRLIDLQTLNYTNDYRFSKGRNLDCVFIMPEE